MIEVAEARSRRRSSRPPPPPARRCRARCAGPTRICGSAAGKTTRQQQRRRREAEVARRAAGTSAARCARRSSRRPRWGRTTRGRSGRSARRVADAEPDDRDRNPGDAADRPQHLDHRVDDACRRRVPAERTVPSGMPMHDREPVADADAQQRIARCSSRARPCARARRCRARPRAATGRPCVPRPVAPPAYHDRRRRPAPSDARGSDERLDARAASAIHTLCARPISSKMPSRSSR